MNSARNENAVIILLISMLMESQMKLYRPQNMSGAS